MAGRSSRQQIGFWRESMTKQFFNSITPILILRFGAQVLCSILFGAAIFALHPTITGQSEPPSLQGTYYLWAAFVSGFLAAMINPKSFWVVPTGTVIGEFLWMFAHFPPIPTAVPTSLLWGIAILLLLFCSAHLGAMPSYLGSGAAYGAVLIAKKWSASHPCLRTPEPSDEHLES
jgi:hypothetical protein